MKVVIQKVKDASCKVNGKIISSITKGLLLYVGFKEGDCEETLSFMTHKILNLRIFEDEKGIMNRSVLEEQGEILCISQFTLYADCKKGNRPSYQEALESKKAKVLYDAFVQKLMQEIETKKGAFGEHMEICCTNLGPTTILLKR